MYAKHVIGMLAGALIAGGIDSTTQAAWINPPGGWQLDYTAADNVLPDADGFSATNYQTSNPVGAAYSGLVVDGVTSETALIMNNEPAGAAYRVWQSTSGAAAGSGTDLITVDFRFRITDTAQPDSGEQLYVLIERPVTGSTSAYYYAAFTRDRAGLTGDNVATAIGNDWHDVRMLIDVANNSSELYLDGAGTPTATQAGLVEGGQYNLTYFGQAGGSVKGQVELAYLRMTNSELAQVPEPASLGLLVLGGGAMLMKRRRQIA